MEKVLVSSCLLGNPVRYDGQALTLESHIINSWMKEGIIVPVCPEVSAGLPTPRPPAEILNGDGASVIAGNANVVENSGKDVTHAFILGAHNALELCKRYNIKVAVLSELSPSCGSSTIYNGEFSSTKVAGAGVTSTLLRQHDIKVFSQHSILEAAEYLEEFLNHR